MGYHCSYTSLEGSHNLIGLDISNYTLGDVTSHKSALIAVGAQSNRI
jgi:hypothetical protein